MIIVWQSQQNIGYGNDGPAEFWQTFASFTKRDDAANALLDANGTTRIIPMEVYESLEEYKDEAKHALRMAALSKLTIEEREVLGFFGY